MGPPTNVDGELKMAAELAAVPQLQWGRRQTSTERPGGPSMDGERVRASMGPPTNVDGEASGERRGERRDARFNGAADKRRRRVPGQATRLRITDVLQWGRRQTSTERRSGS